MSKIFTLLFLFIYVGNYAFSSEKETRRVNLETPQACMENFLLSSKKETWLKASHSLNFRLLGEIDKSFKADLSRQLYFVINQELWIDWQQIPDRSDGVRDALAISDKAGSTQDPQTIIKLGDVSVDGIIIPINLEKEKGTGQKPVWQFSAQTVENIEKLYEEHGPSTIARNMPEWAMKRGFFKILIWQYVLLFIALSLFPLIGYYTSKLALNWLNKSIYLIEKDSVKKLRWPIICITSTFLIYSTLTWIVGLPSNIATVIEPFMLILLVSSFVWLSMTLVTFISDRFINKFKSRYDDEDLERRRVVTQLTIFKHVSFLILILLGIVSVLLQLNSFRVVGIALLSSAGAMAVIIGVASHAVLGNLINGLQIAFMQPFKIGDCVFIENNWGTIEEVSYVDVVVKTWDERRLIFPIGYFTKNWFENWSKNDEFLVKPIYLTLDYRTDVQEVRDHFMEILKNEECWSSERDEPELLVTDSTEEFITVRLTCAGKNPSDAWNLSCSVREKLLAWLKTYKDGKFLPHKRILLTGEAITSSP